MAKFRLTKDMRKEESDIGKRVAEAGGGIAKQKSSSMWGGVGGGLLGAAAAGAIAVAAGVTTVASGGLAAPLWATMLGTGIGAAAGSKLGEEVAEGGGLFKGGLIKAATLQTRGEADYEGREFIKGDSKFFGDEVEAAGADIKAMSESVSDSHMWTGAKAAALAGVSDIYQGSKLFGKGTATVGEVLKGHKGQFTSLAAKEAAELAKGQAATAVTQTAKDKVLARSGSFSFKELSKGVSLQGKNMKFADAGLDLGAERLTAIEGSGISEGAVEAYKGSSSAVTDRFWEQAGKRKGVTNWENYFQAERVSLEAAGKSEGKMFTSMYSDMLSQVQSVSDANVPFGTQDYTVGAPGQSTTKAGLGFDMKGVIDPATFKTKITEQLKTRIKAEYESGASVAEATSTVMGDIGYAKPGMIESIFDKTKNMNEWAWYGTH